MHVPPKASYFQPKQESLLFKRAIVPPNASKQDRFHLQFGTAEANTVTTTFEDLRLSLGFDKKNFEFFKSVLPDGIQTVGPEGAQKVGPAELYVAFDKLIEKGLSSNEPQEIGMLSKLYWALGRLRIRAILDQAAVESEPKPQESLRTKIIKGIRNRVSAANRRDNIHQYFIEPILGFSPEVREALCNELTPYLSAAAQAIAENPNADAASLLQALKMISVCPSPKSVEALFMIWDQLDQKYLPPVAAGTADSKVYRELLLALNHALVGLTKGTSLHADLVESVRRNPERALKLQAMVGIAMMSRETTMLTAFEPYSTLGFRRLSALVAAAKATD